LKTLSIFTIYYYRILILWFCQHNRENWLELLCIHGFGYSFFVFFGFFNYLAHRVLGFDKVVIGS